MVGTQENVKLVRILFGWRPEAGGWGGKRDRIWATTRCCVFVCVCVCVCVCVFKSWGPKNNKEGASKKLYLLDFVQVHLVYASLRQDVGGARHNCDSVSLAACLLLSKDQMVINSQDRL